ncbi:hypothetical protein HUG10_00225 [Halorarum halophilum]|uniref:Rpa-associated protein n=1 Tax=Halorarum halophilum TaxID=2743090 RepID=A0A7D5KTA0_9EURY|nr:hypothetical protein [Halobaculum halophilum]QLG26060.1 hypothetical protein HUG10_00225 [Halobaculum halophilum]
MSSNGDGDDSGPGAREVAHRLFAAEFDDASLEYSESDEERAPNYVVTPTGLRVNRLFAVGVLTEVESVNEETVRGRVVDTTGAFVTYAGQYQPDELAFLDRTTPPAFVALTGKARTFQPEDSDVVYTSVRPESISEVDADTRDRWTVSAAEATLDRLAILAAALELDERGDELRARLDAAGAPEALASGIPRALDHYGTTPAYVEAVRRLAVDALEVVADEREEVRALETTPDASGPTEIGPLPDHGLDLAAAPDEPAAEPTTTAEPTTESAAGASDSEEAASASEDDAETTASAGSTTAEQASDDGAESTASAESAEAPAAGTADSAPSAETDGDAGTDSPANVEEGTGTEPETAAAGSTAAAATEAEVDAVSAESNDAGSAESTSTEDDTSPQSDESDGELGDFDEEGLGDFEDTDPEDFEDAISDEERREVEEEHGVEFASGSEMPEPGDAGIETPEPEADEASESEGTGSAEAAETAEPGGEVGDVDEEAKTDEPASADAADGSTDEEPGEDVDLEDAVVDLMEELDEGDGADRGAVVSAAAERFGVTEDEADDAVQDALMSGKCYEPSEGTLKSI